MHIWNNLYKKIKAKRTISNKFSTDSITECKRSTNGQNNNLGRLNHEYVENKGIQKVKRQQMLLGEDQETKFLIDEQNTSKQIDSNQILTTNHTKTHRKQILNSKSNKGSDSGSEGADAPSSENYLDKYAQEVSSNYANKSMKRRRVEIHEKNKKKHVFTFLKNYREDETDDEEFISHKKDSNTVEFLMDEQNTLKETDADKIVVTKQPKKDYDMLKFQSNGRSDSDSEDDDTSGSENSLTQSAWNISSDYAYKAMKRKRAEKRKKKNTQKNDITFLKNNSEAETDDEVFMPAVEDSQNTFKETDTDTINTKKNRRSSFYRFT